MENGMVPFRVRWRLDRPMVATDRPIALDGLIAWARVEEEKAARPQAGDDDLARAAQDLPLARFGDGDDWVWRASWLHAAPRLEKTSSFWTRKTDVAAFARDIAHGGRGVFAPKRFLGAINLGSGPLKLYAQRDVVQWMEFVEAWGVGDPDRVRALLERVTALGPKRRNSYGRIRRMLVEPFPDAARLWRWRPLPVGGAGDAKGYAMAVDRLRPPYWDRTSDRPAMVPIDMTPFEAAAA